VSARVIDLVGGDIVDIGGRSGTFIGRSDHPIYPRLSLVVWRLDDGSVSLDALDPIQVVGEVTSGSDGWAERLQTALQAGPPGDPDLPARIIVAVDGDEWSWRCETCGALGIELRTHEEAVAESDAHMTTTHWRET
jgi:hypothetical protein